MTYSINPLLELGLSKNNCTSIVGNSGSGPIDLGTLKYTYNENGYPITREQSGGKQFFFLRYPQVRPSTLIQLVLAGSPAGL